MWSRIGTAAFAAALALAASTNVAHAQKALVYCPVSIDASGCGRIVDALASRFPDGVERGYDGTSGTVDLRKADLQHYAVFVVPSLADNDATKPYALLRELAPAFRMAINGRVAIYSGAPDQGATNRDAKNELMGNLATWAANGHTFKTGLVGLVAFLDLSSDASARYSWVKSLSPVEVSADAELQSFSAIESMGDAGALLSKGGSPISYGNMASLGLHIGTQGAALASAGAIAGTTTRQVVLVKYSLGGDATVSGSASTSRISTGGASTSTSTSDATASTATTSAEPTLTTDKQDYQPGDTVTFTGTGFGAQDTVVITLHEDPHWQDPDRTVTAIADASGNFTNRTFVVDQHDFGVTFTATAVGNPSGRTAQTTFTDGNKITFGLSALGAEVADFGTLATNTCQAAFVQERQGNSIDVGNHAARPVALSAAPNAAQFFVSADCTGSTVSSVTIPANVTNIGFSFRVAVAGLDTIKGNGGLSSNNNASAIVTVGATNRTLTVAGSGGGTGTVTSSPAGISCTIAAGATSGTCSAPFANNTAVTLTATASGTAPTAAGSTFDVWSGDGTGTTTRAVTMDADKSVGARFKANQTITFAALSARTYGDAPFSLTATASSGLTTTFTSQTAATCSASGGSVTLLAQGLCTIRASQAGNTTDYNAAADVDQSFTIGKKNLTATLTASDKTYDGATTATITACTPVGVVGTDAVTCTATNAQFASANASATAQTVTADVALGGAGAGNYTVTTPATTTAKINPKAVVITPTTGQTKVYGTADPAAFAFTNDASLLAAAFTGGLARVPGENVASYAINSLGTLSAGPNYLLSLAVGPVTFAITVRPITVTADAKTKVYGDADPALTYQITSGSLAFSDAFTGALTRAAGENVSTYAIQVGTLSAGTNYNLTFVGANLGITARPVTITADAKTKVYGDADPALTYQISAGTLAFSDAFTGTLTRAAGENVGAYAITQGTVALSTNYTLSFVSKDLTITARPVTITADAKTKVYGEADPALTYQISAGTLAFSDAFTGTLTRAAGSNVGPYAITQGTVALSTNYTLSFVSKNLTITARPITVTADPKSKVYGNADPSFTYAITSGNLIGTDALSGLLTRVPGESVGSYAIQEGELSAGSNYALTFVSKDLTITARPITVTADAKTKVYGYADPALTYQITTGTLAFSDAFTGALTRAAGENVGTYAIQQGTLALTTNYTLTYAGANLGITVRPIAVKADAKTKTYGDVDPAFTYQITSGSLAFSDAFSGALSRDAGQNVGTYAITQGGLTAGTNYNLTFVGASLGITVRSITVTADAKTKVYGDADPALTYQITNGSLAFSDAFSGALARDAGETIGTYAIKQGTLALNTNYALTYAGANLGVTVRPVTITVDAKTKVYGDADPALTYQITSGSLAFSDAFSGTLTRVAGEPVGAYAITQGTVALNANYTLSFVSKDLTITARPLTITADAKTKVYGEADPALTYQISAGTLAFSDAFTGTLTRAAGSNVGAYAIMQGTVALSSNYTLSFVSKNLTITPRPITVTADPKTKVYGNADPSFTYAITSGNLIGTDALSGLLTRVSGENVGAYAIQKGELSAGSNYDLAFVSKDLTITARPITVTADAKTKVYGDADPALTYAITSGTLAFSDAFTGALNRAAGDNVGAYPIQKNTLALSTNYTLTYVGASLSITPRPVTVMPTAPDLTWTGSPQTPVYALAVTSGSLAYSQTTSVLGAGVFSPASVTLVNTYPATVTGLSNANYAISTVPGSVKVLDKSLPTATITELNPVPLNTAATVKVNVTDVATGNSNIVGWKYSIDGVYVGEINVATPAPNVNVTASLPAQSTTDVIRICAQGKDAGGNWSQEACALLAIYDPSAGFVTGGGWIDSPPGAYAANPLLVGRANFGFVSKYQKGSNVPTGNTEFQFQSGNLNFKSTAFQWLVIQGTTQAQFKGTGTINGSGNYNFMVTAVDGDNFNGSKKPDAFRIKITDAVSGAVVYDNQNGTDETGPSATNLSGGSIQIHDK